MTRVETLTGVPDDQIDEIVADYESEDATVVKAQQADGDVDGGGHIRPRAGYRQVLSDPRWRGQKCGQ